MTAIRTPLSHTTSFNPKIAVVSLFDVARRPVEQERQDIRPDAEVLSSYTEYSFYIGTMNLDSLFDEMALRGLELDIANGEEARDLLLTWYDSKISAKVADNRNG